MKFTSLSLIPLTIAFFIGSMTIANGETNNRELQEFCQKFPYNTKCDDVSLDNIYKYCRNFSQDKQCESRKNLISLEERQGESFYCRLTPTQAKKSKNCKILVKDETIIAYLEEGEAIKELDNQENTQEIVIDIKNMFDFNSQWWLADVGNEEESVGMFADIQIGYLLKDSPGDNKTKFLTISANKDGDEGFSNENIPKLLEQLEPWLYHNPDLTAIARQLKLENNSDTQVNNNIQRLLDTNECPRCNLKGADLSGTDLERANLEGANLEGANLEGAKLKRAYLVGANLSNANLHKTNFENSIMFLASLENSDLSNANLQATNLQYSNLNNADLTQAKLDGNGLNVTQLQNAKLINVNLTEANLKCANLDSANLRNANLTQANLEKCQPKTIINKGDISNFLLNNAKISTPLADLGDALTVISSILSIIANPNNNNASTTSNVIGQRGVKFTGKTNLNNANLSGANLTETILDGADLFNSNLNNATLDYTDLRDTDLSNSNLIDAKISNSDLEEAFLCNTIMPDVSIVIQGCLEDEEVTEEDEDN